MKVIPGFIILLVLGLTELQAQSSFTASGGDAASGAGSISYSLGQIIYDTQTGTSGIINYGIQLPFEIFVINGINVENILNLFWSVFPNPTSDFFIIKTENPSYSDLKYQMIDINGKILDSGKIINSATCVKFRNASAGIYFLKVFHGHLEIRTFKIIKK